MPLPAMQNQIGRFFSINEKAIESIVIRRTLPCEVVHYGQCLLSNDTDASNPLGLVAKYASVYVGKTELLRTTYFNRFRNGSHSAFHVGNLYPNFLKTDFIETIANGRLVQILLLAQHSVIDIPSVCEIFVLVRVECDGSSKRYLLPDFGKLLINHEMDNRWRIVVIFISRNPVCAVVGLEMHDDIDELHRIGSPVPNGGHVKISAVVGVGTANQQGPV